MATISTSWSGIESEELNSQNWVQVAFRFNEQKTREYRVFGQVYGEDFGEYYYSEDDDNKSLAYSFYWEQLKRIEKVQTWLYDSYEVWDGDFLDLSCESCAVKFAQEHGLEWRGGKSQDSFTEDSEELGKGASCTPSWAMGESDSPQSCACGVYLKTNFTSEGIEYLKGNFPRGVQELYGF